MVCSFLPGGEPDPLRSKRKYGRAAYFIMEAAAKVRQEPFFKNNKKLCSFGAGAQASSLAMSAKREQREQPGQLRSSHLRPGCSSLVSHLAVELHYLKSHFGRRVHVLNIQPLFHGVNRAHAGAEVSAFNAFAVEDIGVTATS